MSIELILPVSNLKNTSHCDCKHPQNQQYPIMKMRMSYVRTIITIIIIVVGGLVVWINDAQIARTGEYIHYNITDLPSAQTVMILGASVLSDGTLSRVAQDRADAAIIVWKSGKADSILVSADNRSAQYDETRTIRDYLIDK